MKENEQRDKYLHLARELKNAVEHEGDDYPDLNRYAWNGLQELGKETGEIGNQRKNRDYTDLSTIKIN